jgi:hypothetical protein
VKKIIFRCSPSLSHPQRCKIQRRAVCCRWRVLRPDSVGTEMRSFDSPREVYPWKLLLLKLSESLMLLRCRQGRRGWSALDAGIDTRLPQHAGQFCDATHRPHFNFHRCESSNWRLCNSTGTRHSSTFALVEIAQPSFLTCKGTAATFRGGHLFLKAPTFVPVSHHGC